MVAFDSNAFLSRQSGGESAIQNIGMSFGVPNCMFDLLSNPLLASLIPTPILAAQRAAMQEAEEKAKDVIHSIAVFIKDNLGISLFPDKNGSFGFFSAINKWGKELFGVEFIQAIGSFMGTLNAAANAAAQLYDNYLATVGQIDSIKNCLGQLQQFLASSRSEGQTERNIGDPAVYAAAVEGENAWAQGQLEDAQNVQASALACLQVIDAVLAERELDPDKEPRFANLEQPPKESVFRLQAGPPKATNGQFILSVDGLYYDSSEGLIPALTELSTRRKVIEREKYWNLDFDPSLGGRGKGLSLENIKYYFNSLLDPNKLDESKALQKFYNADRILLNIQGQKNRKIFDVSSEITEMVANGESQIIIDNMNQNLISETAYFTQKENKRKKQIELAVKIPVLYGKGPIYGPGEIPVNDFSYMEGVNFLMEVQDQRKLVITQDDVTGVVLPLEVKYTQKIQAVDPVVVDHLLLSDISRGAIIDHDAPSSTAPRLSITNTVVEDNLLALYNILTAKGNESLTELYGLFNSSEKGEDYNARIVGDSSSLFVNGLGTAYLSGVNNNSYIRLPPKPEFQDLLYSKKGATFEAWIQLSGLTDSASYNQTDASGLYRLILANENTGIVNGVSPQKDREILSLDEGTSIVRGMVLGFTRDRRFTQSLSASNRESENSADRSVFIIAPTQSYDETSVGFLNKDACNADNTRWHGLTIPVSSVTNGVSLSDCSDTFCHLAVTFNPKEDSVSVYLDGVKLTTSSYYDTFGTGFKMTPKIPSMALSSSFEYAADGPKLDKFFTPWVIGGGYTDGLSDGFMGGTYGGKSSALQGKLGSIKFYVKPLSDSEVSKNYEANKNFFKYVKLQ